MRKKGGSRLSVTVPVHVFVKPYIGSKETLKQKYYEKLKVARMIEDYINEKMQNLDLHVFMYYEIASDLDLSIELVHDLLYATDCGSNGITVFNPAVSMRLR
jgi:hypothetical protein